MSTFKKILIPLALGTSLSGCIVIPPALTVASLTIDNFSYMVSGKSVSEHALSKVSGRDCSFGNVLKGKDICKGAVEPGEIAVAEANSTLTVTSPKALAPIDTREQRIARTRALAARPVTDTYAPLPIGGAIAEPVRPGRSGVIAMSPSVPAALPPRKPEPPLMIQVAEVSAQDFHIQQSMVDMSPAEEPSMVASVMGWFR